MWHRLHPSYSIQLKPLHLTLSLPLPLSPPLGEGDEKEAEFDKISHDKKIIFVPASKFDQTPQLSMSPANCLAGSLQPDIAEITNSQSMTILHI